MICLKHQKLFSYTFCSSITNKWHWQGYGQACSQMEALKNCDQKATKGKITSYPRSNKMKQWRLQTLNIRRLCWHIVNHSTVACLTTSMSSDIPSKIYQKHEKTQIEKAKQKRKQRFWKPSYWTIEELKQTPFLRSSHPHRRKTNTGGAILIKNRKNSQIWSPQRKKLDFNV